MTDRLTIIPQPISPVSRPQSRPAGSGKAGGQFDQLLQEARQQGQVRFSGHAQSRMAERGINFSPNQLERLQQAVKLVDTKGGRDSLVMLDDTALVVNVKNETVVTVVDREQMKNNVFTKIDSAVIA